MPRTSAERRPAMGTAPQSLNNSPNTSVQGAHVNLTAGRPAISPPPDPAWFRLSDLPDELSASIAIDPETGEWIWSGPPSQDGYGRHKGQLVHRLVYLELVGEIRAGPRSITSGHGAAPREACCSPWHLEPVTKRENGLRGDSFAGRNFRKTECDHGHLYTEANTYRWNGQRDSGSVSADASPSTGDGSEPPQ